MIEVNPWQPKMDENLVIDFGEFEIQRQEEDDEEEIEEIRPVVPADEWPMAFQPQTILINPGLIINILFNKIDLLVIYRCFD